jgi:NTE family protein
MKMLQNKSSPEISEPRYPKIGVALGGGGARALAHIGVLKVLEENGLPVGVITGTSMGAVVGAAYLQAGSAEALAMRMSSLLEKDQSPVKFPVFSSKSDRGDHFLNYVAERFKQRLIINLSFMRKSLFSQSRLDNALSLLIEDKQIEDLPATFGALASDLISGKGVVLRTGSLKKALIASSSIPGFFPPVECNGMLLVDGEATDLIPVEACRALGAEFVIAVDVNRCGTGEPDLRNTLDVFLRTVRMTNRLLSEKSLKQADIVLRPISADIQWTEFERLQELIAAGEAAAREQLPEILNKLRNEDCKSYNFNELEFKQTHIDSLQLKGSVA